MKKVSTNLNVGQKTINLVYFGKSKQESLQNNKDKLIVNYKSRISNRAGISTEENNIKIEYHPHI